jgi:hypothetical protein
MMDDSNKKRSLSSTQEELLLVSMAFMKMQSMVQIRRLISFGMKSIFIITSSLAPPTKSMKQVSSMFQWNSTMLSHYATAGRED